MSHVTFRIRKSAERRLSWIEDQLADGNAVRIGDTTISPKTPKKMRDRGRELFRIRDSKLYIAAGNKWECIDGKRVVAMPK